MKPIGYDLHAGRTAMPASIEIAPRQALESRDLPGLFPPGTKTYLCDVGVDAVKDAVFARLKLTEPGPGAIHFTRRLDADYFRQLTAERVVTRFEKGRPIRSWQPKRDGERNEALDTFVYAHAALHGLISMGMRLNEEAEGREGRALRQQRTTPSLIRSSWMG